MRTSSRAGAVLLLALVLTTTWAASQSELSAGTIFNPTSSPAEYYLENDTNFSGVTVFPNKVNFSQTNVSTLNTGGVGANVSLFIHNFSKSSGTVALYNYNTSAETKFFRLDTSKSFRVVFNDTEERIMSGQKFLNVTIPSANTNLTVQKADSFNKPPNTPANPSPANESTGVSPNPELSVVVSDPDGDSMDVEFEFKNGTPIGEVTGVADGGTASVSLSNLENGVRYNWTANASDGSLSTKTGAFEFTTNSIARAIQDSQTFTNKDGHVFEVQAQGLDQDGDDNISGCFTTFDNGQTTGTIQGTITARDTIGNSSVARCKTTISSSVQGLEVGDSVSVETFFTDGPTTGSGTGPRSNTVPNRNPTIATPLTKTDLNFTQNNPEVAWLPTEISDPDGDPIDVQIFTGTQVSPSNLDVVADESPSSANLGQRFSIQDGLVHYYRLGANDSFGGQSAFSSDDRFVVNQEPQITRLELNNSNPSKGDTLKVLAEATDENITDVNISVEEGDQLLKQSGELTESEVSGTFESEGFKADETEIYNFSVEFTDNLSETNLSSKQINLGFETAGSYTRTFSFTKDVREARVKFFGDTSGGSVNTFLNTTESNRKSVENDSFAEVSDSKDVTVEFELSGDGGATPKINSYDVDARTDFKTSGTYRSDTILLSAPSNLEELRISETQPTGTNATYEIRAGNSSTVNSDWTDYTKCLDTCNLDLGLYNHTQLRVELSGTSTKAPEVESTEVAFQ